MKSLVLGGNGFIGSHLVKALCRDDGFVRVFDRNISNTGQNAVNIEYVTGDFTDTFAITKALADIDIVYHLISTTVPSTSNLDMINDIETNLVSTINLLKAMVNTGVNKIVFYSSGGTVYGNPIVNPISELHQLNPICSYGIVKVAIEKYLFLFNQQHSLEYNILRVSNPYGANQQCFGLQGVITTFLLKALKNEPITIWGDGTIKRDYIYINDLIEVSIKAGKKMHNDVFNVGSGVLTSINDIVRTIEEVTNHNFEINKLPKRNFDVQSISLDCLHAKTQFDWIPVYELKKGVLESWEWIKNSQL